MLRRQQAAPDGQGGTLLREMEHPCPAGCGPEWKHPHAELDRVIEPGDTEPPQRIDGEAKAAQQLHPALGAELKRIYERYGRS
ncbi:hypothetical protein [Actinokineospora sp.]|uniref:hypothetical protein n=1 Tax=Actinokineospora sp. TaxID=1872133 RepID=UPI003D6AA7CA